MYLLTFIFLSSQLIVPTGLKFSCASEICCVKVMLSICRVA